MNIEVNTPILNAIRSIKQTKFNINFVASILLVIIMIVIPILFLPYVYTQTSQLMLTYYFTGIALCAFIGIKIYEIIKAKRKINWKINIKLDLVDYALIIYSILIFASAVTSEYFPQSLIEGCIGRFEGATTLYLYIILFYIAHKAFKLDKKFLPYMATSTLVVSCVRNISSTYII